MKRSLVLAAIVVVILVVAAAVWLMAKRPNARLYGVTAANQVVALASPRAAAWQPVAGLSGAVSVKYNATNKTLYGVGTDGTVYVASGGGAGGAPSWAPLPGGGSVYDIAFDPSGNLYAAGTDTRLFTKGLDYTSTWVPVAPGAAGCCAVALDFDRNGVMYAVTPNATLNAKASADPTSAWVPQTGVGMTSSALAIDRASGTFYSVDAKGQLVSCKNPATQSWALAGAGPCCVISVAAAPPGAQP